MRTARPADNDIAALLDGIQRTITGELGRKVRTTQRRTDDRLAASATRQEVERRIPREMGPCSEHKMQWGATDTRLRELEDDRRQGYRTTLDWAVLMAGRLIDAVGLAKGFGDDGTAWIRDAGLPRWAVPATG
jgi:hypothetical protein